MSNPLLSVMEWVEEVISGKNEHAYCQWRGQVVPTQPLASTKFASELLQESHARFSDQQQQSQADATDRSGERPMIPEPYSLEMADGTLVTFFLVRGARKNMRELDVAIKSQDLGQKIAAYMNSGQGRTHSFGIYFLHDPETAGQVFQQKFRPLEATAKRLGGDATVYKNDLGSRLIRGAAEEMTLFTVRTHLKALRQDEIKVEQERYRKLIAAIAKTGKSVRNIPLAIHSPYGQALLSKSAPILHRHEGLVNTLLEDFNGRKIGIAATLVSIREAFERVGRFADREIPQSESYVRLAGQEGNLTGATSGAGLMAPLNLGMQVLTKKIRGEVNRSMETSNVGGMWYGTSVMEMGPTSPRVDPSGTRFSSLMTKIRGSSIPMSVSMDIFPDGLGFNRINQTLATFLGAVTPENKLIKAAYDELKEYDEKHQAIDPIIGTRMVFSTWGKSREQAEKRLIELQLAIRGWGSAVPSSETGSPETARLSAIPEFMAESDAPVLPAPLQDILYMSPITRTASPWEEGQLIMKTTEGALYPIAIGSSKHASYLSGVVAPSGSGKSFTVNKIHACLALSPGAMKLPYGCLIDVAPSGEGCLRLLRQILPESLWGQLIYYKVVNHASACVNPFDLQLGCTGPTPMELDFQMSVLEAIFAGMGEERSSFVSALIKAAYEYYAPNSTTARLWQSGLHERVAKELREIGFDVPEGKEITAYRVTDELFAAGRIEAAIIAQRFAVPRLEDLNKVINSESMKSRYGNAKIKGEPFLEWASRAITNGVDMYPLLASVTRIDIDNARIKVIDLQSVLAGASDSMADFKGLMYLYARHLGARHFFLDKDEMRDIVRDEYRDYQMARVREIQQTPKFLTYDEWHNVKSLDYLVRLNEKEGRESRKFRVYVTLVTQYAKDYPEAIISGMTTLFVVGQASLAQNEFTRQQLDLSDTDFDVLRNDLDRMGRIWVWFRLRDGMVTATLDNDVGPLESWCYTTDDKDAPLRNELAQLIGERDAMRMLAKTYPTGSAAGDLDKRARQMAASGGAANAETGKTVTSLLARELSERFYAAASTAVAA
jgi:intracellular multiplication protein IcmB